MTDGIVLKFSTTEAVAQTKVFDESLKRTFETLGAQGKLIQDLEGKLRSLATAQSATAKAAAGGTGPGSLDAFTKYAAGLRQYDAAIDGVAKKTPELAQTAAVAAASVGRVASSANATVPFLQKLLGAAGQSGAAKGLGLLGAGAKALVTSMNPVGIATGIAAAAVVSLAANALSAQTGLEKLSERAKQAQVDFDLLANSSSKISGILQGLSGAVEDAFSGGGLAAVETLEKRLSAAVTAITKDLEVSPGLALTIEQVKALGDVLRFTSQQYRDIEDAGTKSGDEQRRAIERLKESGIDLTAVYDGNILAVNKQATVTLKAADAIKILDRRQFEVAKQIAEVRNRTLQSTDAYDALNDALLEQIRLSGLGSNAREVTQKLDALAKERGGIENLTQEQKDAAAAAIAYAKSLDLIASSSRSASAAESARDKFTRQLEDSAKRQATLIEDQIEKQQRYRDVLRQIDDERKLVNASPEERRRIEVEQRIKQAQDAAGVTADSAEGRALNVAVRNADQTERQAAALERVKDLGREAFATIGASITDAIQRGEGFRGTLKAVGESLSALALQRSIQALFNAGANAIFGPPAGSTPAAARGAVINAPGGPTVALARGGIINRLSTMAVGGANVSMAEGGASTPEAVMPLRRDNFGRLGVIGAGGGGSITVVLPGVRSGDEARRIRPTLKQTVESIQRNGRSTLRAGR